MKIPASSLMLGWRDGCRIGREAEAGLADVRARSSNAAKASLLMKFTLAIVVSCLLEDV
jgi:hypothetical protein